jgi:hypothetical protein
MVKGMRNLAGKARAAALRLRADHPNARDAVRDYADALSTVAERLAADILPIGALQQLARAHGLVLATLVRPR